MQNKFFYDEPNAAAQLSSSILRLLPASTHTPIIIMCIGTDRSTGDSLGPLVGMMLIGVCVEAGSKRKMDDKS